MSVARRHKQPNGSQLTNYWIQGVHSLSYFKCGVDDCVVVQLEVRQSVAAHARRQVQQCQPEVYSIDTVVARTYVCALYIRYIYVGALQTTATHFTRVNCPQGTRLTYEELGKA